MSSSIVVGLGLKPIKVTYNEHNLPHRWLYQVGATNSDNELLIVKGKYSKWDTLDTLCSLQALHYLFISYYQTRQQMHPPLLHNYMSL